MPSRRFHRSNAKRSTAKVRIRTARSSDLDALIALERRVFDTDQLSRRSLRRLLGVSSASVVVAEQGGRLAGTAITLFRPRSRVARLYSIAVAPHISGRGVARRLLGVAEQIARKRGCAAMRLEVHQRNRAAISCYRKCGYLQFGRHTRYYEDGGDALRFEKAIAPRQSARARGASRK